MENCSRSGRTKESCEALDQADELRSTRERFHLPDGIIYMDGNSLGPMPKATPGRLEQVMKQEWAVDLITSWNVNGWVDLPLKVGGKIAKLIGAETSEVVVADSTSINLFKVTAAALQLRLGRSVVLTDGRNFPTDLYMLEGLVRLLGGAQNAPSVKLLEDVSEAGLAGALTTDVAAVVLTHVSYRTGCMLNMAALTALAHRSGALVVWDLAHSAGAVPVDLGGCAADFAVGCGYKFLNGGPGAPAFLYVAARHQADAWNPLCGWFGHAHPFVFQAKYKPATGIARHQCGTPPILSLAALEVGVDIALDASMVATRRKSLAMSSLLVDLVDALDPVFGLAVVTPTAPHVRGSQVCIAHKEAYRIVQALIRRGVIGDFRAPDIIRLGITPLYVGFVDVWNAVIALKGVMQRREWDDDAFDVRNAVT